MVPVERIWRVKASPADTVEIRLSPGRADDSWRVELVDSKLAGADAQTFDVDVARAIAQAMLEACEVASALGAEAVTVR
jgi:hypothetical protein